MCLKKICFYSPVFCIVQHTRPHVIINHTYIDTGLRTNKHHIIHLFMPTLLAMLRLQCFGYAWSICWKIKSWQRCLSTLMIRLLSLRWKRVAASMDIHIIAPATGSIGLVSYMLCCRLLESTNYSNKIFKNSWKKPTENNKKTGVTWLNSKKHGSQEDKGEKDIWHIHTVFFRQRNSLPYMCKLSLRSSEPESTGHSVGFHLFEWACKCATLMGGQSQQVTFCLYSLSLICMQHLLWP